MVELYKNKPTWTEAGLAQLYNMLPVVISLDFSEVLFDAVRHSTMLKTAQLDMPDEEVHNWFVQFFSSHSHSTVQPTSGRRRRWSPSQPVSFDLRARTTGNEL